MVSKSKYAVNYEGWLIVTASNEEQAAEKANKILSESDIINDGDEGEWNLSEIEKEEE